MESERWNQVKEIVNGAPGAGVQYQKLWPRQNCSRSTTRSISSPG